MAINIYKRTIQTPTKGLGVNIELDLTQFNKAMDQYVKFQKRLPADIINGKLYYIARNATMTTKSSDKGKIETELRGHSKEHPTAPLAAILINYQLGKQNKKGLTGEKMARAVEKFISKRKQSVNFVRAGWKNAIQILETYMRSKGELPFVRRWASMAPVDKETMKKKNTENLGTSIPARIERIGSVWGEIQNDVHGKNGKDLTLLDTIKTKGLQEAVNKEVRSMQIYLDRKMNPVHNEWNKKMGF